ncbi:MAG: hypothetical protein ICV67_02170 [Thermoleophilia bacterium]|nr:hypothetical protein [Thermoleophilia bacterium]
MELRALLEGLEAGGGEHEVQLAYLAAQALGLAEAEVRGARRRALLVLASGGDPRRELEPDGRAVSVVAEALDAPGRAEALRGALGRLEAEADGLPAVSAALDRLLADDDLAWRWAACALLAEELAG